jgi:hypothetical protein
LGGQTMIADIIIRIVALAVFACITVIALVAVK